MTSSKESQLKPAVWHTTTSDPPSAAGKSKLRSVCFCPVSWPNTPSLKVPRPSPSTPPPNKSVKQLAALTTGSFQNHPHLSTNRERTLKRPENPAVVTQSLSAVRTAFVDSSLLLCARLCHDGRFLTNRGRTGLRRPENSPIDPAVVTQSLSKSRCGPPWTAFVDSSLLLCARLGGDGRFFAPNP